MSKFDFIAKLTGLPKLTVLFFQLPADSYALNPLFHTINPITIRIADATTVPPKQKQNQGF